MWIWSDRIPRGAPTDEAASAAFTDTNSGPVDFDFKAEARALVDFPDELGKDFGIMAEARALVDFPNELEGAFGAKAEPAALGASAPG